MVGNGTENGPFLAAIRGRSGISWNSDRLFAISAGNQCHPIRVRDLETALNLANTYPRLASGMGVSAKRRRIGDGVRDILAESRATYQSRRRTYLTDLIAATGAPSLGRPAEIRGVDILTARLGKLQALKCESVAANSGNLFYNKWAYRSFSVNETYFNFDVLNYCRAKRNIESYTLHYTHRYIIQIYTI